MAYAPIQAAFFDHDKYVAVVEQDARAVVLHFWAIAHANEELTDGFVATIQVRRRVELGEPLALAGVLVSAGLWDQVDGGFRIHDFLDWNLSAEQVQHKRDLKTKRQGRWLEGKRGERDASAPSSIYATADASRDTPRDASIDASIDPTKDAASDSDIAIAKRSPSKQSSSTNGARGAQPAANALACLPADSLSDYEFWYAKAVGRDPDARDREWLASIYCESGLSPPSGAELLPLFTKAKHKDRPASIVCLELRDQRAQRNGAST